MPLATVCGMHGSPHRGAFERIADFEVGVVLMPVGAGAVAGRLEEDLVEMQQHRIADQLGHGLGDLGRERHRAEKVALVIHRAELQVGLYTRMWSCRRHRSRRCAAGRRV